jgi:glycosyltransferase involved in cell wall biosynthesis
MIDCSVLITCYNKEQYLDECVQSILRQTKQPKEIIIVHDGCDEPMAHNDADTIILHKNSGVTHARHEAFRYSSGKLILFVDGDDALSPDYLEKMVLTIASKPLADIAYPDTFIWATHESRLVILPDRINAKFVQDFNKIVIPVTCLMKREVYETVGGFREWPVLEDVDFWLRAMAHGYTFKKSQTLLWYRRYGGTRNGIEERTRREVMRKILDQFSFEGGKITFVKDKL